MEAGRYINAMIVVKKTPYKRRAKYATGRRVAG